MPANSEESDLKVKAAAYLYSIGRSQKEIRAELNVSQPTVSRLLIEAKKRGWLATAHRLSADDLQTLEPILFPDYPELCAAVNELSLQARTCPVDTIRVFDSGCLPIDGVATKANRTIFGSFVARHLRSLQSHMQHVGVTWGKTLASVVQAFVSSYPSTVQTCNQIIFFPVCGEAVNYAVNEFSASTHASQLHNCVNRQEGNFYSLGATPSRIPKKYYSGTKNTGNSATRLPAVLEFFRDTQAYRRIFLGRDALINKMDTLLATAGQIYNDPNDLFMSDLMEMENITPDDLEAWTIGDIGGVFIPRPNLKRASLARVDDINSRWTGIRLEQIKKCASKARKTKKLGVLLPVIGHSKAEIVAEVIRQGLVNHLVLDYDLANHLLRAR